MMFSPNVLLFPSRLMRTINTLFAFFTSSLCSCAPTPSLEPSFVCARLWFLPFTFIPPPPSPLVLTEPLLCLSPLPDALSGCNCGCSLLVLGNGILEGPSPVPVGGG